MTKIRGENVGVKLEKDAMTTLTPGHANSFNPWWEQLLNNDASLKAQIDSLQATVSELSSKLIAGTGTATGSDAITLDFTATPGTQPGVMSFNATAKSAAGTIASYVWTFGDGQSGVGVSINHTYVNTTLAYTVTLKVKDNAGNEKVLNRLVTPPNNAAQAIELNPITLLSKDPVCTIFGTSVYNVDDVSPEVNVEAKLYVDPGYTTSPVVLTYKILAKQNGALMPYYYYSNYPTKTGSPESYIFFGEAGRCAVDRSKLPPEAIHTARDTSQVIYVKRVEIKYTDRYGKTGSVSRDWPGPRPGVIGDPPGWAFRVAGQYMESAVSGGGESWNVTIQEAASTVSSATKTFNCTYRISVAGSTDGDYLHAKKTRYIDYGDGTLYTEPNPDSSSDVAQSVSYTHTYAQTSAPQTYTVRFGYLYGTGETATQSVTVTVPPK